MTDIEIVGGGRVSTRLVSDIVFPDPAHPEMASGWRKTYELTATADEGWTFVGFEYRRHHVWWSGETKNEETYNDEDSRNPWTIEEENCETGEHGEPDGRVWISEYLSIRAVFKQSSLHVYVKVEPSEAEDAGCAASFDDGETERKIGGRQGEIVEFDLVASRVDEWRFYAWKNGDGTRGKIHQAEATFRRNLPGEFENENEDITAVFKPADGLPLCAKSKKNWLIACRPGSGEVLCND